MLTACSGDKEAWRNSQPGHGSRKGRIGVARTYQQRGILLPGFHPASYKKSKALNGQIKAVKLQVTETATCFGREQEEADERQKDRSL